MKLLIIGGVAGGATAAARARRVSESAEITLLERGPYVSFANCGLPYYISGDIEKRSKLLLQTPEGFDSRYGVKVLLGTEAVEIDRAGKRVKAKGPDGDIWLEYDKLILAQGGNPILPPLPGADSPHAFKLWTVPDVDRIQAFIKDRQPKTAVVVGGGFIGLEMAEAFHSRGIKTTVVELAPHIMITMDREFGERVKEHLSSNGINVITGAGVKALIPESKEIELSDGRKIPAELVLFSVGVKPELTLAKQAGLTLGESGGLLVDEFLRTSDPDIYAAGDMVELTHRVSGKKTRIPLAGPANRQGRIAATNALVAAAHDLCGADYIPAEPMRYRGAFGTSVVKILDATAAATGLTEKAARDAGFDVGASVIHKDHHAGYYPGGKTLTLKLVYDRKTGKLLGAQAFGLEGVEKRIDVLATALAGKLTVQDIAELDLAYAPPYSSANDPVNMAAFVAANDISGFSPTVTAEEAAARYKPETGLILDVRNFGEYEKGHVRGSVNIPVDELRSRVGEVPADKDIFVHCAVGFRAHLAVRILKSRGFKRVWNVTGGYTSMKATHSFEEE
jgi:NADPH-dependent 2,4-dienoyl-CoA reductase/sulfur reductase-like enzyme/rhodanese-related sulfurtransferase